MERKLHLVMPMGGAGTRFFKDGFVMPKPLIEINEKPFLYWATRSIEKYVDIADLTFVVTNEHIKEFKIDEVIKKYYPNSIIKSIDFNDIKSGPVMTCLAGIQDITDDLPILFNDCDHMFRCDAFNRDANSGNWDFDGALLTFKSDEPQFSYIQYEGEKIVGTVEKKVVSQDAICGAYVVKNANTFKEMSSKYLKCCNYSEFFVSGVYNVMCQENMKIKNYVTDFHVPFGTPKEYRAALDSKNFDELK